MSSSGRTRVRQTRNRLLVFQDCQCYRAGMAPEELAWLAGLLEGEGSFCKGPPSKPNSPRVALSMTDEDVVSRVALLLGVRYHRSNRGKAKGWKPCFMLYQSGRPAVALMQRLRPLMGNRRQGQIDRAVACYTDRRRIKLNFSKAQAIRSQLSSGSTVSAVARKHGVSRALIRAIRDGDCWKMGP